MVVAANIRAVAAIVIDKRFINFGIIILQDCAASRPTANTFWSHCIVFVLRSMQCSLPSQEDVPRERSRRPQKVNSESF